MQKSEILKSKMFLLSSIMLLFTSLSNAEINNDRLLSFPKPKIYSYEGMIYNQPIVLFNDEKEVENLNQIYFTKHGKLFNYVPYSFFINNTDKLIGFNNESTLFPNTLGISEKLIDYQNTKNPITRKKVKNELINYINSSYSQADYSKIYEKEYYSDLKIKKVRNYNSKYNRQNLIFDHNQENPNIKLICKKNGQKYAYVNPTSSTYGKFTFDSYSLNTPIYLEIPDELKDYLSYYNNKEEHPICEYTKEFKDLNIAEKYINYINNGRNRFIIRFALNKNNNKTTYLSGHITYFGLTVYDGIDNNRVFTTINGKSHDSDKDVLYSIAEENLKLKLKNLKKEEITATEFLNGNYAYKIGLNYYFKVSNDKTKALIFNIKNRFLADYDLTFNGKEIRLKLKRIIRENDYNFPREILIYKEHQEEYKYFSQMLLNLKDEYIEFDTDMQNNLVFDFESLMRIP